MACTSLRQLSSGRSRWLVSNAVQASAISTTCRRCPYPPLLNSAVRLGRAYCDRRRQSQRVALGQRALVSALALGGYRDCGGRGLAGDHLSVDNAGDVVASAVWRGHRCQLRREFHRALVAAAAVLLSAAAGVCAGLHGVWCARRCRVVSLSTDIQKAHTGSLTRRHPRRQPGIQTVAHDEDCLCDCGRNRSGFPLLAGMTPICGEFANLGSTFAPIGAQPR